MCGRILQSAEMQSIASITWMRIVIIVYPTTLNVFLQVICGEKVMNTSPTTSPHTHRLNESMKAKHSKLLIHLVNFVRWRCIHRCEEIEGRAINCLVILLNNHVIGSPEKQSHSCTISHFSSGHENALRSIIKFSNMPSSIFSLHLEL